MTNSKISVDPELIEAIKKELNLDELKKKYPKLWEQSKMLEIDVESEIKGQ